MRQKRIKEIIAGIILLLVIAAGIRHAHFQSVDSYQKEQEELAESLDIGQVPSETAGIDESGDKETFPSQTEVAQDSRGKKDDDRADSTRKVSGNDRAENQASPNTGDAEGKKGSGDQGTSAENKASSHSNKDSSQAGSKNQAEAGKSGTGYGGSGESFAGGASGASAKPTEDSKEGMPAASASQQEGKTPVPESEKITCTIEISCSSLLENKSSVDESILKYVPQDGYILPKTSLSVEEGSSVYDVLAQVCKAKDIALDAQYTPMYKSYYLRGIGHIYEKQAGDRSGWIYEVNGVSINKGASSCKVAEGDVICWQYTCDGKNT